MPTDDDDERICRYCFEGDEAGELLSPCDCKGDQKYVHLSCLRRWQRTVLVSQPTHPAFYERDPRHYKCNVCKGTFTCEPPSRLELCVNAIRTCCPAPAPALFVVADVGVCLLCCSMASFTGPELGALIQSGCVIASHAEFTAMLQRELDAMPEILQERSSYRHWCGGVYLITEVQPLDPAMTIDVTSRSMLEALRVRLLASDLQLASGGGTVRLVPGGALEGVADERGALMEALPELRYTDGMQINLAREPPPGVGDDHVTAINLARLLDGPVKPLVAEEARGRAIAKYAGCADVAVLHYIGGPCGDDEISCCVVAGGTECGWTIVDGLADAIELAHQRAYPRHEAVQGAVRGGMSVRLMGLQSRADLNGEVGIALRFSEASGRWLVRLKDGDGKQLKPDNLAPISLTAGVVHCVWGDAQWSRTQLLGEIARGHWGLCRASIAEIAAPPSERWAALDGRLVFAPETEMTEDTIRQASLARQMEREAALNARAGNPHQQDRVVEEGGEEEGGDSSGAAAERLSGMADAEQGALVEEDAAISAAEEAPPASVS